MSVMDRQLLEKKKKHFSLLDSSTEFGRTMGGVDLCPSRGKILYILKLNESIWCTLSNRVRLDVGFDFICRSLLKQ